MTSYKDKEIRLNYNSDNQSLPTNWKNIFSHLGKICSLTSAQNFLSKALLCTLLMFAGVIGVWAQEEDISGTYYIGNYGKNADANNKYYLCPTEGWYFYTSGDGVQKEPNGQPFLTTYKCLSTSGYDTSKAVWIIEKHPEKAGCYYIKQKTATPGTYKYIVSNGQINGSNNANRMRVHLQEISNAETLTGLGDMALFELTINEAVDTKVNNTTIKLPAGHLRIKPHAEGGRNGGNIYLVANNGNYHQLNAQNSKTDGPDAGYGRQTGGIISIYELEQNAGWYLEDVIKGPAISFTTDNNTDNNIKITGPTGTTKIYYTTNGDRPTVGGATTTEVTGATASFDPDPNDNHNVTIIKAIAIVNGETTNVSTFRAPVLLGTNHKRLIQSQANEWGTDFHFYMIPGDNDKVNTTSLFRPTMEWYFLNAGIESNTQYYYIVNVTNGKYLCYDTTNKVYLDTYVANETKFKFSITESATMGTYNIKAYNTTATYICKASGNADPKVIDTSDKPNTDNTRWKFVLTNTLDKTAPFTASVESSTSYYKIQNASTQHPHFIIPPISPSTYVTASNSEETNIVKTMNWYLEVAQAESNDDWLTYYYIRNAVTGDYLFFTKDTYNVSNSFEMRSTVDTDDDHYKFAWARTATPNQYYIVPKVLKDPTQNTIGSFTYSGSGGISTNMTRSAGELAWLFLPSTFNLAEPGISFNATDNKYHITSEASDAKIYYRILELDNQTVITDWTLYDKENHLQMPSSACFIEAYAYRSGDKSDESDVASFKVTQVATPTFNQSSGNSIAIECETEGATIYYTYDGSDPTTSNTKTEYTHPLTDADTGGSLSGKTIKAIAVKAGSITSEVKTSSITLRCATPVVRRGNGNFALTCSFPATGVTIKYSYASGETVPGEPTLTYSGPVTCTFPITIKAIATASDYGASEVLTKYIGTGLVQDENNVYLIESEGDFATFVSMVNGTEVEDAKAHYKLIHDIDLSNTDIDPIVNPFKGIFEADHDAKGTFYKITGLKHALFNTVDGGTVKNVMLDNVTISGYTSVTVGGQSKTATGAIANVAIGASRIYNCGVMASDSEVETDKDGYTKITSSSSSINQSSDYVGGLVGFLDGTARVINCYSFANIGGGTNVGGIVGWNNVATTAAEDNQKTMVMNCMFYGDITVGTSKAPIYNGEIITNDGDANGVNNFNYFWAGASYVQNQQIDTEKYNCALSAETRYLQRFEFFRHILNSNRELAAWWASTSNTAITKNEIMKWVMEPSKIGTTTPYPILKVPNQYYPSVVNIDAPNAEAFDDTDKKLPRNKGRKFGTTFTIYIQDGTDGPTGASITTPSVTRNITDKDPEHFNFNYYKVQLPYYNDVGTKNYTGNKVVTGWKVSVSGGTHDYTTGSDATATVNGNGDITLTTPYNFADRKSTGKDDYGTSERVFSQGAYFDVPEGVESITIKPYWGKCVYVADEYMDVVYKNNGTDAMATTSNVTTIGGGKHYENDKINIEGTDYTVYKTMKAAVDALNPSGEVYDNAIVLVGNVHSLSLSSEAKNKPYTIMSIDLDKDNEPDYSYILRFDSRKRVHPVRIDFLNVIGLGMAQKTTGGTGTYNFGIMQPYGWFECTNTGLFRVTQFEYDLVDTNTSGSARVNSPMILHGGVIEQWVTVGGAEDRYKEAKSVSYYHIGGNVWFKEFHIGVHQDKNTLSNKNPNPNQFVSLHSPISITGGDFDEFYLTGLYNTPNNNSDDNAECYINGGRFGKVAGTGMQGIGGFTKDAQGIKTNYSNGNIVWQIDNADIDEFYAGGINAAHIAEGDITTVISNSRVDQFCGGPKFGDMNNDKTVVTNATNCTFRAFFGAGYGGNSYNRRYPDNKNNVTNINWNDWVGQQYKKEYNADYSGVETRIDYQFLPMSGNTSNVARLFVDYVSFSLATTYDVTSKLTGCTITTSPLGRLSISDDYNCLGSFYGGGSLGKVNGPVKSTLTNCTVEGSVYGAGYSASTPKVNVMANSFQKSPSYDSNLGAYLEAKLPTTEEYTWEHSETVNNTNTAINTGAHKLYTTENLNELGTVTGQVTLNIEGTNTAIAGNVYGGGQSSDATGDVVVNVNGGTIGPNSQSEEEENGNVYGGGQGKKTVVGGDVTVNIGTRTGTSPSFTYTGTSTIKGSVYGGSALGDVNATKGADYDYDTNPNINIEHTNGKETKVNIYAGTINGSIFGGGKGDLASLGGGHADIEARNFGNTTVTIENSDNTKAIVNTAAYGGSNINGVLKENASVTITGGTIGTAPGENDPIADAVFGGGKGQKTIVQGNVIVNIGDISLADGAIFHGSIYGGSALGNTNASWQPGANENDAPVLTPTVNSTTAVNLYKGTVKGDVYGGGLGVKEVIAVSASPAVYYTQQEIDNANEGDDAYGKTTSDIKTPAVEAVEGVEGIPSTVGGNVTVELNNDVGDDAKGCIVEGAIFGCNNANGTPLGSVTVHIYGTQYAAGDNITQKHDPNPPYYTKGRKQGEGRKVYLQRLVDAATGVVDGGLITAANNAFATLQTRSATDYPNEKGRLMGREDGYLDDNELKIIDDILGPSMTAIENALDATKSWYDVQAIYGGGNEAEYKPTDKDGKTEVIIDGCDRTSICYVYGGGNAAAVPATDVTVNSAKVIDYLFGGGNGERGEAWAADVGYDNSEYAGTALTKLIGGTIYHAFGGSNSNGDVKGGSNIEMPTPDPTKPKCTLTIKEIYGAGQNAQQSGGVKMILGCVSGMKEVYGGAQNANIDGGVTVVITSGTFEKVFGGNNLSGTIHGPIKVSIEETACDPIIIDELYLGGYQAPYSIFGYYKDGNDWKPRTSDTDEHAPLKTDGTAYPTEGDNVFKTYDNPVLDVISCTSIGKVFGGGLGKTAIMYGSPTVNINMIKGAKALENGNEEYVIPKAYENIPNITKTADGENNTIKCTVKEELGTIGEIYGGGSQAKVVGSTIVNIGASQKVTMESGNGMEATVEGANIIGNVYGGGQDAEVTGNTQVNICAHEVTTDNTTEWQSLSTISENVTIAGSVYGAGKGANTDVASAIVRGNSTIQMGGGWVKQNIYGGGELSCVGDFTFVTADGDTKDDIATYTAGGTATINIFAGTVGPENQIDPSLGTQAAYGHVFGAGQGNVSHPKFNYAQATDVTISGTAIVEGSVFGGSENGHVRGDTDVKINGGTVGVETITKGGETVGNIYGGGKGTSGHSSSGIVKGNTNVTISGGTIYHNIYGGGAYGSVGTITYNNVDYVPGQASVANMPHTWADNTGTATVTIKGGTIGINGQENGMIFGSSRGDVAAPVDGSDPNNFLAWVKDTEVTIGESGSETGPTIFGSVYGSGENGHVYHDTDVKIQSGIVGVASGEKMKDSHNVEYDADDYPYRGNVYGGGCGEDMYDSDDEDTTPDMYNPLAGIVLGNTNVTITGGHVVHDVFGAGALGSVGNKSIINVSGGRIGVDGDSDGNVYGAARGDLNSTQTDIAHVQETEVNILPNAVAAKSPVIWNNVFGGGQAGIVKGSVAVNVTGGEVKNDVYGGGALADTNTDNWDTNAESDLYVAVTGLTVESYSEISVQTGESVSGFYTESNGAYTEASGTAVSGTKYYERTPGSNVSGYWTRTGNAPNYTYTAASGEAKANTIYYEKTTDNDGGWVSTAPNSGEYYTTKVEISGGTVGNVYGGGLGRLANGDDPSAAGYVGPVKAMVYGDVTVTINGSNATGATNNAKFTQNYESRTFNRTITNADETTTTQSVTEKYYTTGRVFGCNNINGTPKGNVNVTVWSTTPLGGGDHIDGKYEIQEVYGGGNLSAYMPAEGRNTEVNIHGCDHTSILYVFGGGNAATVPETEVNIHSCREIETVFGGGNGNEPVKNNSGQWVESDGADVHGAAKLSLKGGLIHSAFAGSFVKGTCGMTVLDDSGNGSENCTLKVTNMYGGGKDAPVLNGININISGCSNANNNSNIENIFAGSYNARISNGITMNITGGMFKKVFGGNDQGGFINGPIEINVEETGSCNPIIIENLYGSGNFAPYPGPGTNTNNAKITINIKSCTYIGNVFGGGYGMNAVVTGNTELNINMMKGNWAGAAAPTGYSSLPNVHQAEYAKVISPVVGDIGNYYEKNDNGFAKTQDVALDNDKTYYTYYQSGIDVIDDAIGTIGNVFGGGDLGAIDGNTTINIGNATQVGIMKRNANGVIVNESNAPVYDEKGMLVNGPVVLVDRPVLGANITGNVYGGGNEAEVTGNTYVNISALMTPVENSNPTTYTYSKVNHSNTANFEGLSIGGSVYGGGNKADVKKNTNVRMSDGYVFDGVYGGGLMGSVGTAADGEGNVVYHTGAEAHAGCIGKIVNYKSNTGKCTVVVSGGQVGPAETAMTNGGMKNTGKLLGIDGPVDVGFVFGAGRGDVENPATTPDADFHTFVKETDVTIGGTAFIMASVYGGGENGRVAGDTHVTIKGDCQIGCGEGQVTGNGTAESPYVPQRYNWADEDPAKYTECASWNYTSPFLPHDPYAAAGDAEDAKVGTDGHTYYGSVFGGGSGYYPYKKADGTHEWLRSAGVVYGNTVIDITGGHILTCVYGGNETTDVGTYTNNDKGQPLVKVSGGKCTINMVGGTLGVPRTDKDAQDHPVTCYLFGAGKGDQRTRFNTWTNVQETEVNVSGTARIFGSVFGGGEDGHVLGDAQVNIGGSVTIGETTYTAQSGLKIGTYGTSYVDGNVFGGGRGFSGIALTAGSTGGNAEVNISGGTMLGSIYGGGRLASVGIDFTPSTDPLYGQLVDDDNTNTHGHIAINISGGTIGNDVANAKYGGNVFGGSMGRITLLDGTLNPIWPKQAVTKDTEITITGNAIIKKNVYGGSEFGIVRDKAIVNIGGTRNKSTDVVTPSGTPTIHGSVYGGGYGSDENTPTYITAGDYAPGADYVFTPMIWTGCVSGDTEVNIAGGTVEKNVYGGGEVASVGLINCHVVEDENGDITIKDEHNVEKKYRYTNLTKHDDIQGTGDDEKAYGFALSWPYKFEFISGNPREPENIGGKATVNVTGGHIGSTTWDDRTGYVFGGSKGQVAFKKKVKNNLGVLVDEDITDIHEQRYVEGLCANVRETEVNIKYSSTPSGKTPLNIGTEANCIMGAVYGGGEDGHVYENAAVNITNGLIGLSVYGGGKGEGTFTGTKYVYNNSTWTKTDNVANMPSWTAGKVYGNTSITMSNGHVMGNVYGGGNLGSVGKGNYAGGTDDYYPAGYGETLQNAPLWTKTSGFNPDAPITESNKPTSMADYFLSSGKCKINITGGTVGTLNGLYGNTYGTSKGTPTGIVFGGSRGRTARDVGALSPRYEYAPDFFLGYCNNTEVTIGTASSGDAPRIYSQVFGGARDGHVRGSAHVIVRNGIIGQTYAESAAVGTTDVEYQRKHRGNVYGSGSGLGTWDNGTHHGTSSGSVTRHTQVDIYGGTIYNNVYGGGAMASVGPPKITMPDYAPNTWSGCQVNIYGGEIGKSDAYEAYKYGGCVYGASRGGDLANTESVDDYATTIWNEVNIMGGTIAGDVYGGGEAGRVKKNNKVNLTGGIIKHDAYGGGKGTTNIAADVGGSTTVELNIDAAQKAQSENYVKGCIVDRIFGCNNLNGTPKGHVTVHVYATQTNDNSANAAINKKNTRFEIDGVNLEKGDKTDGEYLTYLKETLAGQITQATNLLDVETVSVYTTIINKTGVTVEELKSAIIDIRTKMAPVIAADKTRYDVQAVYGGGNLAAYIPNGPGANENGDDHKNTTEKAEVIIDGCELTSIYQVYGGGNAASTPATQLTINSAYEIFEAFGGGNGNDDYYLNGERYLNPGANVGFKNYTHFVKEGTSPNEYYNPVENTTEDQGGDATTKEHREANYGYGTGIATTNARGGTIHTVYGGSNKKGNIRTTAMSAYESSDDSCPLCIGETYGAGKDAPMDGDIDLTLDCVKDMPIIYGGAKDADVNADITLNITNGTFERVYGGNNNSGNIYGSITVNVEERGCQPINIDELYAGGYLANYSKYGYYKDSNDKWQPRTYAQWNEMSAEEKAAADITTPHADPRINVKSATHIGTVYGGGYKAKVIGSPHVNVNMTTGRILAAYGDKYPDLDIADDNSGDKVLPLGSIGTIFGGGNEANIDGDTYVEIGTGEWLNQSGLRETTDAEGKVYTYNSTTKKWDWTKKEDETTTSGTVDKKPTPSRNEAKITDIVYGGGNNADVTGNTYITMENGSVYNRIYGGGNKGNVGTIETKITPTGHSHTGTGTCILKPDTWKDNTGVCNVTVSGGRVGPLGMTMPDDYGYVFGAGRGETKDPAENPDIDFEAYVKETNVTIEGTALICGGVYGGSENGRVRGDTHVYIKGGQIGVGEGAEGAYDEDKFINPIETPVTAENALAECAHWDYKEPFKPYDAVGAAEDGATIGSDGHTFYGNVFGGGSGYYPYKKSDNSYEWLPSAGQVEGNTHVNVTGGHILTSLYGGNEMTDVKGTCYVTMTGGTLGVPRTLSQIADHPITCYLFGAGKGDQRTHFNTSTNIANAEVTVGGKAIIYGSIFGGGEDGHVLENTKVTVNDGGTETISNKTVNFPIIGTTGTSYVDGNIFGGGRGFSGEALTAGSVGGNTTVNINGGTILGSIYGGGRIASIGTNFVGPNSPLYGAFKEDKVISPAVNYTAEEATAQNATLTGALTTSTVLTAEQAAALNEVLGVNTYSEDKTPSEADAKTYNATLTGAVSTEDVKTPAVVEEYGHITVNISGGSIGNDIANAKYGGNVFGGSMGRLTFLDNKPNLLWAQLAQAKTTAVNITGGTIKRNVYGGGELGTVRDDTHVSISGTATIANNVFGGGYGSENNSDTYLATITADNVTYKFLPIEYAGRVGGDTHVDISGGLVRRTVYGGGEMASVGLVDITKSKEQQNDENPGSFYISWPFRYEFIKDNNGDDLPGGTAYTTITGGRIGLSGKDIMTTGGEEEDNGDIFGGGKGKAGNSVEMGFCGNVRKSVVTINVPNPTDEQIEIYDRTPGENNKRKWTLRLASNVPGIAGSVYGGAEDGHVIEDTEVNIQSGYIGHGVYGGGKGKGTYKINETDTEEIPCVTAGKVYGNTTINMTGGWIMRNIYGGGNLGSVGKGNYAVGADDYNASSSNGYGEKITGNLWNSAYDPNDNTSTKDNAWYFMYSGKSTVNITGGKVGYMVKSGTKVYASSDATTYTTTTDETKKDYIKVCEKDDMPTGDVFGGCRGQAATEEAAPTITDNPDFFLGYVNQTEVNIGKEDGTSGPTILGSVYGGGQDGHVRRSTDVTIYKGEIGVPYNTNYQAIFGEGLQKDGKDVMNWLHRGNVYGSGSGIGTYESKKKDANNNPIELFSSSSGSVTHYTNVTVNSGINGETGGIIYRNVYGGGSVASVGPPVLELGQDAADKSQSLCTVTIDGTVGYPAEYEKVYGGEVYGASRGETLDPTLYDNFADFAAVVWTKVLVKKNANILGNVFGGGDAGIVKKDTEVIVGE